ncbi:hypothetical protein FKM82_024457 [Ascaphus truei]
MDCKLLGSGIHCESLSVIPLTPSWNSEEQHISLCRYYRKTPTAVTRPPPTAVSMATKPGKTGLTESLKISLAGEENTEEMIGSEQLVSHHYQAYSHNTLNVYPVRD